MTSYGQHYNKRSTPQSEKAHKLQKPNNAGGFSFVVDDFERLQRFLVLGSEGGTYYVGARPLTRANAECVERCLDADGGRAVELIATISEQGRAPKNEPAIFALAIACAHSNPGVRSMALRAMPRVCRIGTHLFQFCGDVSGMRGWGRGLRQAIGHWYRDKDPDKLAYQVLKYQQRAGWSHRDVLRKAHVEPREPKGSASKHAALFRWIVGAEMGERSVGKRAYAPVAGMPKLIEAYAELKAASGPNSVAQLILEHGFTHEMVPNEHKDSMVVWDALLHKMPMTAMIRNLAKMTSIGLLKPMGEATKLVVSRLHDSGRLHKARVHPIALLSALMVYKQGRGVKGSLTWSPVGDIIDALDEAFYLSFDGIEPTGKNTMLALDVSGSMTGSYGGHMAIPGLSPRSASAAMAMVTARTEPNHVFTAFSSGMVPLSITKKQRLDNVIQNVSRLPFDRTDCALPMLYAAGNDLDIDTFVVYTDNETWFGHIHPHQALEAYRQKSGRAAKLIVVGMTATEFTIANPLDKGMLDVVGFDTAAPQVMADFARAEM